MNGERVEYHHHSKSKRMVDELERSELRLRVVVNKFVGKETASLIFQERLTHENRARVEYYLSKKLTALFNFPTPAKLVLMLKCKG